MPLIRVTTSLEDSKNQTKLLQRLSSELSIATGKPESYVMVILEMGKPMIFAGEKNDPACFIEIKSIGSLNPKKMTSSFCNLIFDSMGIPKDRIYIAFEDINGSQWGYDGNTFG